MSGVPIPNPSFLDTCEAIGARTGKKRWRSHDGKRLYEWDALHGEIEMYNKRGKHLGALDGVSGALIKEPIKGRTIDV